MVSSFEKLKYHSKDVYEGQILNGKRSGYGKMRFANGDQYIGMWKSDQMCDPDGHFTFKNGNHYWGSFGQFDGQGKLILKGLGEFTGKFSNTKADGQGKFVDLKGKVRITDTWKNSSIEELVEEINKKLLE